MKQEIIEMARQAGIKRRTDEFYSEFCDGVYFDDLEAFAKLVAAKAANKEREWLIEYIQEHQPSCKQMIKAIDARGQA